MKYFYLFTRIYVQVCVPLHHTETQKQRNHGKLNRNYRITVNNLGNRFNRCKKMSMKTKLITTTEYARLIGLSTESGIISRRLRKFHETGTLVEMPGVINISRHGNYWMLEVLTSWIDGKEMDLD